MSSTRFKAAESCALVYEPASRLTALLDDWCAATGRDGWPLDVTGVEAFFEQVPVAPSTRRWRERLLRRLYAGRGLAFPIPRPEPVAKVRSGPGWLTVSQAVRRISVGGVAGVWGRRDAVVLVLLDAGLSRRQIHEATPRDVDLDHWLVAGRRVAQDDDVRSCPRCVLVRWLVLLAALPPVGFRSQAQRLLLTRPLPGHDCQRPVVGKWSRATHLVPSVDQHWWTGYEGLSMRSVSAVAARRLGVWVSQASDVDWLYEPGEPSPAPTITVSWKRADMRAVNDDLDALLDRLDRQAGELDAMVRDLMNGTGSHAAPPPEHKR